MDIWRLLSAIIRRWYIIIPLLIATVAAAATIRDWVPPEYQASAVITTKIVSGQATVQPVSPKATVQALQQANPYLSPTYTAGVLQYVLSGSKARQDLVAAGLSGNYVIKAIPNSSFIGINITANDPELAMATGHGVIESARRVLAKRQGAIEASTPRVSIDVLDDADTVSVSASGQLQSLAAVLAVGGIVSVIATVLVDDLLLLRRRRRARQTNLEETPANNGAVRAAGEAVAPGTRG